MGSLKFLPWELLRRDVALSRAQSIYQATFSFIRQKTHMFTSICRTIGRPLFYALTLINDLINFSRRSLVFFFSPRHLVFSIGGFGK